MNIEQKRWTANRESKQRAKVVDSKQVRMNIEEKRWTANRESNQRAKEVDSEQVRLKSEQMKQGREQKRIYRDSQ
jgi:hypothetical protein